MGGFEKAFEVVVGLEGGYVNDPHDPGGETKFGITKRQYPGEDIAGLTLARAQEIYRHDYWQAVRGDELPWPLALLVFDSAVNQGVGAAIRNLQATLGVKVDGDLGSITLGAAAHCGAEGAAMFMANRILRYVDAKDPRTGAPLWPTYGRGWAKRCFAVALASGGTAPV